VSIVVGVNLASHFVFLYIWLSWVIGGSINRKKGVFKLRENPVVVFFVVVFWGACPMGRERSGGRCDLKDNRRRPRLMTDATT
jgi:hypothetical protein